MVGRRHDEPPTPAGPRPRDGLVAGLPEVVTVALAVAVPVLAATGSQLPGRTLLTVLSFLAVPGLALGRLLRLHSVLATAAVATALSVAIQLLVGLVLLDAGLFSPLAGVLVTSTIGLAAVAVGLLRTRPPDRGTGDRSGAGTAPTGAIDHHRTVPRPAVPAGSTPPTGSRTLTGPADRQLRTDLTTPTDRELPAYRPAAAGGSRSRSGALRRTGALLASRALLTPVTLVVSVAAWALGVAHTDLDRMNGLGLLSVLDGWTVLALLVLSAAIVHELTRGRLHPLRIGALLACLAVELYALQNAADSAAGVQVSWIHLGFAQYIQAHGHVLADYDARFSWPAFFAAAAAMSGAAGRTDVGSFLRWAPPVYEVLYLVPLALFARFATSTAKVGLLGVALYTCGNWFEQDYFSPQATNMVLDLTVIALLSFLAAPEAAGVRGLLGRLGVRPNAHPPRVHGLGPAAYLGLGLVVATLVAASIVSHQLTPIALIGVLVAFRFTGLTRFRSLWLLAVVMFAGYFSYGAFAFWSGHLSAVVGDVGKVGATVGSGVGKRLGGDPQHLFLQYVRVAWCGVFAVGGLVGLWRLRPRFGPRWLLLAALAYGPFGLALVQSYGGEVVLRIFLYALPAMAMLLAEAVRDLLRPNVAARAVLTVALTLAAVTLLATRGANQPFERVTVTQLRAQQAILRVVPAGASIGVFNEFTMIDSEQLRRNHVINVADTRCDLTRGPLSCVAANPADYLYLSATQAAYGQYSMGLPTGWSPRLERQLVADHGYRVVYANREVTVLKAPASGRTTTNGSSGNGSGGNGGATPTATPAPSSTASPSSTPSSSSTSAPTPLLTPAPAPSTLGPTPLLTPVPPIIGPSGVQ